MCCIEQGGTANLMGRIVDGECLLSIFISFYFIIYFLSGLIMMVLNNNFNTF